MVDIRLKASSVSRVHAKISVNRASFYAPTGSHKQTTVVCVVDFSAYGTFLKYPKNHAASREEPAGHHRRLNKEHPTEVYEGAFLAFGAPSAWWQVCWYPLLVLPSRLPPAARTRLGEVAAATSLQVADQMSENVTHLVTCSCVSTSQKFLIMLARNGHVVQPAWLEALHMIVINACTSIAVAESDDVASTSTNLPMEENYLPPFSEDDAANYVPDILQNVLKPTQRGKRKNMFENIVFAFETEDRSYWWAPIVDILGGVTVMSRSLSKRPELKGKRVLYMGDKALERRNYEQNVSGMCSKEKDVIECILRADLTPIESTLHIVCEDIFRHGNGGVTTSNNVLKSTPVLGGADVTDVATPGPLDADSDAESDVSGAAETYRASSRGSAKNFSKSKQTEQRCDTKAKPGSEDVSQWHDLKKKDQNCDKEGDSQQKRVRSNAQRVESGNNISENDREIAPRIVGNKPNEESTDFDGGRDNERVFFAVQSEPAQSERNGVPSDGGDVRPFRRRRLPSAPSVPLKRVKVLDETKIYNTGGRRLMVAQEDEDNELQHSNE
ncbi:Forkhead-associated (FHA) [Gracilaria domingensis]|nr:Forkhead-associated (FHA) [Gracilaria domingensis]